MRMQMLLAGVALASLSFPAAAQKAVSYKKDVQPLLDDYCVSCHVPGEKGFEKTRLDLRTYKGLMRGTKFGPIIKPGDSVGSTLIMLLEGRADPSISMPFGVRGNLTPEKLATFKRWIDQGAKDN